MSVHINGKNMDGKLGALLFYNGKDINKMYHNGMLIFQKASTPSGGFGTLTYLDNGQPVQQLITDPADFYLLFDTTIGSVQNPTKAFTFGNILLGDCIGWEFNLDRNTSPLPSGLLRPPGYNSYYRFLQSFYAINSPITIPDWITSIGDYFLAKSSLQTNAMTFNSALDLNNVTSVGSHFLWGQATFNQPLDVSGIQTVQAAQTTAGGEFLWGCEAFNQPLSFTSLQSANAGLLADCEAFDSPLVIGPNCTFISSLLCGCTNFNSTLDIQPNTMTIGDLLSSTTRHHNFRQTFELKAGWTITGVMFRMAYVAGRVYNIVCNIPAANISQTGGSSTAGSFRIGPQYNTGTAYFNFTGNNAAAMQALFPDFTSPSRNQDYRKIQLGT